MDFTNPVSDIDLDLGFSSLPDHELGLQWKAEHTGGWKPVEGGVAGARVLIAAVDGEGWPYSIVERADSLGVQVMGDGAGCVLELSPAHTSVYRTVTRTGEPGGWWKLPAECRYWVPTARDNERFSPAEAAEIAARWLRDETLGEGLTLAPVRYRRHRTA